ncbi:glutaminase [filamentous cyanobacterium LEGE 11480]|uniref:glutaminase n=1 Tax=Romeriopsis navalis LEGE 11480 TaxID=2777977 RepID=A0A928Z3T9_9CYAN|nr:glutaminase [Romeriopsis navalis]MBE9030347.1 glutaminase [Romeriopsis navalis LEGE 11480]
MLTANSIVLDEATNRPYNPMVKSGAITTTDLIQGDTGTKRLKHVLDLFKRYTGGEHDINVPISRSEKSMRAMCRTSLLIQTVHVLLNWRKTYETRCRSPVSTDDQ